MTYKEAQIAAYTDIEASIEAKILTMQQNYREALGFLRNELQRLYAQFAGVREEDWYNLALKTDRLNALIRAFQDNYNKWDTLAQQQIKDIATEAMQDSYYKTQYIHACYMPEVISASVLPGNLLDACVTGQAEALQKITDSIISKYGSMEAYQPAYGTLGQLLKERAYDNIAKVQQTITQGILRGKSIKDMTEDIQSCFSTIEYRAQTIARTEGLRCSSAGQYAYTRELVDQGIRTEKMWLCNLDDRTRDTHRELDGKIVEASAKFRSSGHEALYPRAFGLAAEDVNCRCTMVNLANGMRPQMRTAYNPNTKQKEPFTWRNYADWRKGIEAQASRKPDTNTGKTIEVTPIKVETVD